MSRLTPAKIAAFLVGIALLVGLPRPARADIPVVTYSGTLTATGATQWYSLFGEGQCAVVLTGSGTGMSMTVQGASDAPPATPVTILTINGSGVLTANGTFAGTVASYALTGIRLNVTAITGGTENYFITCSPAGGNVAVTGPNGNVGVVLGTSGDGGTSNNALATFGYNYAFNASNWDRIRKDTYAAGPLWVAGGGSTTSAAITAGGAGPFVLKGSAGRLMRVVITTAGTSGAVTFYDNASACSGTILGIVPGATALATAVAGAYPWDFEMPAANGITACGATGSAAVTASFY